MFRRTAEKYRKLAEVLAAQTDDSISKKVSLDGLKRRAWQVQDIASSFEDKCRYKTAWAIALLVVGGSALILGGKDNKLWATGMTLLSVGTGMRAFKDYRRGRREVEVHVAALTTELDKTGWTQKLPQLKL